MAGDSPICVAAQTGGSGKTLGFGWINVVLAALLMLATLPGRTQGLSLITEPLTKDLGLNHLAFAQINLWATLIGSIFCFPAGYFMDRFGWRFVAGSAVLVLAITVWQMSTFSGGMTGLFVLILLSRSFGQSALSVISITLVGKSCGKRLGLAMAVYSILLSCFFIAAFIWIGHSVSTVGWRAAWNQIAIALAFAIAPLSLLFIRQTHEAQGGSEKELASQTGKSMTLFQSLGTPAFWIFGLCAALFAFVSSGLGLFNEAVLAERGFDQKTFHTFLAVTTFCGLAGQFLCGWLAMKHSYRRLMGVAMLLYAVALGMLPFIKHFFQLWAFAGLIGIVGGFVTVLFFAIWRHTFGSVQLGHIQGAAQLFTVIASATGPLLFAECVDLFGSYAPILLGLAVITLLLSVAAWNVVLPKLDQRINKIVP